MLEAGISCRKESEDVMEYMFSVPDMNSEVFEADKKAIDAAREVAEDGQKEIVVWRKVATVTPVMTTEVTMHTGESR